MLLSSYLTTAKSREERRSELARPHQDAAREVSPCGTRLFHCSQVTARLSPNLSLARASPNASPSAFAPPQQEGAWADADGARVAAPEAGRNSAAKAKEGGLLAGYA